MAWDTEKIFECHGMGWDTAQKPKNGSIPYPMGWDGVEWDGMDVETISSNIFVFADVSNERYITLSK